MTVDRWMPACMKYVLGTDIQAEFAQQDDPS